MQEMAQPSIEYLHTRAQLVNELKQLPHFALEILDRLSLNDSLEETISFLESAMTGKHHLFKQLTQTYPKDTHR